jgi:hypothetical protein
MTLTSCRSIRHRVDVICLNDKGRLIIADRFHADIIRPSAEFKLNVTRRKNVILRLSRQAAQRLRAVDDG